VAANNYANFLPAQVAVVKTPTPEYISTATWRTYLPDRKGTQQKFIITELVEKYIN